MAWPCTFDTEWLRAEYLRAEHLPELRRMHADPIVMRHLGGVFSEEKTQAYMARGLAHWDAHRLGVWIVYERGSDDPIGRAVLRHLHLDGYGEIETGYAFYQPYWGRGFATEITRACLTLGFEQLHCVSIVAVTTPENTASQHVLYKCGFTLDRHFERDGETLMLFRVMRPGYSASSA